MSQPLPDQRWLLGIRGLPSSAIVTSIFGMIWINQGIYAWPNLESYSNIAIIIGVVFLGLSIRSLILGRRALKSAQVDKEAKLSSSIMKKFGITVAIEFALIFIAYNLLTSMGLPWAVLPATSLIVGLHFFPLARIFGQRSMLVIGAIITLWTVAVLLGFPDTTRYQWFIVGVGAGVVLFVSSARNLIRANSVRHDLESIQSLHQ